MSAEDYVLKKNKGEDSLWPVYEKNSHGFVEELRAERGTIEEIMTRPFDQLESLVDMIGDDMYHHFGFVAETVIADGKRRIKKACQLLTDKVGEICFDTPQRDAYIYDRLPCWVHVWPEEEPKEEQRRSRHDKSHPGHGSKAEGNQQVAVPWNDH